MRVLTSVTNLTTLYESKIDWIPNLKLALKIKHITNILQNKLKYFRFHGKQTSNYHLFKRYSVSDVVAMMSYERSPFRIIMWKNPNANTHMSLVSLLTTNQPVFSKMSVNSVQQFLHASRQNRQSDGHGIIFIVAEMNYSSIIVCITIFRTIYLLPQR